MMERCATEFQFRVALSLRERINCRWSGKISGNRHLVMNVMLGNSLAKFFA
jgi:hypothetical protein